MLNQYEREVTKTLKSIDGTLKRIEKIMNNEGKQHETICNAVSHALNGEKYEPIHLDSEQEINGQVLPLSSIDRLSTL